ncbi:C39 family peptidase [Streptomyces sp. NPDC004752]
MVHPVPYYAQWETPELVEQIITGQVSAAHDPAWAASGATTPDEYAWWSRRLCGMACLRMALHHYTRASPPRAMDLARDYTAVGAYVHRPDGGLDGLIYTPFAAHTRRHHALDAQIHTDFPLHQVAGHIRAGHLVMLSVHPSVRTSDTTPPHTGGHLVLAVGTAPGTLTVHNPSGFHGRSQQFVTLPLKTLDRFYAHRGIVLDRAPNNQGAFRAA